MTTEQIKQEEEIRTRVLSRNDYYSLNPELAPRSHTDALALVGILDDLRKQLDAVNDIMAAQHAELSKLRG